MNKKVLLIGIGALVLVGGYMWWKKSKAAPAITSPVAEVTPIAPEVQQWMDKIKADPAWLAAVAAKAKQTGVSADAQLLADAKWMVANPNG